MSDLEQRGRWAFRDGQFTKIAEPKRAEVAAPFVQTDEMNPTECLHCGEYFTSKARMLEHYRTNNLEVVFGERPVMRAPKRVDRDAIREDVMRAENDLRWGNAPVSEMEKERCLREEREYEAYKKRNGIR